MKRKISCFLLTLAIIMTMLPATIFATGEVVYNAKEITTWSELQEAIDSTEGSKDNPAAQATIIKLEHDLTAITSGAISDTAITIAVGKNIILDLNGHILDRGLSGENDAMEKGSVIFMDFQAPVGSKLTIIDSNPAAVHKGYIDADGLAHIGEKMPLGEKEVALEIKGGIITGGIGHGQNGYSNGGGIYIGNYSEVVLSGGSIVGNIDAGLDESYGGGIYVSNESRLTMTSGSAVIGNRSIEHGGGIYVNRYASFVMNGGLVRYNTANTQGGGIYCDTGEITINDGIISNNTADIGGGISNIGTLTIYQAEITNNAAKTFAGGINSDGLLILKGIDTGVQITDNDAQFVGGVLNQRKAYLSGKVVIKDNSKTQGALRDLVNFMSNVSVGEYVDDSTDPTPGDLHGSTIFIDQMNESLESITGVAVKFYTANSGAKTDNAEEFFHHDESDGFFLSLNNSGELEISTKTAIKWNYYGDGDFNRPYPKNSSNLATPQSLIIPGMWIYGSMGEFWYKYEKAAGLTFFPEDAVWLPLCDWTTGSGIASTVPGIYKVSWYIEPDANHTYTEFYGQQVTRDNPAYDYTMLGVGGVPPVISPVLYTDLQYTGMAQKLCSAGSIDFSGFVPDESIIEYAVGADNVNAPETGWSEAVPSRTEIGEYYVWHRWIVSDAAFIGYAPECLGCVEITAPAPVYDAPDPVVSIPANHGYDSVKLKATVSGSNATLKEITDADMRKLLGDEGSDTIVLNFSELSKNVKSVTLPKKTVEKIEAAMQKKDSKVEGLTINTPNGTILLPSDTVTELLKQAEGNTIKFAIEGIRESKLTKGQKEAIKKFDKAALFDIYIESNGKRICTTDLGGFGGEVALMLLPYEMQKGQNKHNCKVFYIAEDGTLENIPALYNEDGQDFILELEHLSVYAVLYSENAPETCAKDSNCPLHEFSDTNINAWYHDGVHYCIANGIMKGVGGNLFKPTATISRAEIVTMLWRLAGEPYVNYYMQFKDVKEGEWYSEAVRFAAAEKIVEGYEDGSFMPDKVMTREEVATVLCRFAKYIGQDIDKATEDVNTLSYNDIFDVSEWAKEGMHYCIATDIMEGNEDECVMPLRKTTRAEAATMIYRFCEKVLNK